MSDILLQKYADRVGYSENETMLFKKKGHRVRQIERLSKASGLYSIEATVVKARHCNSGHKTGQKIILDVDGNLISKLCPKRMCVYLISQLVVPVALINERLNQDLAPGDFHFMRYVQCPDVGIECLGYGNVMVKVDVVPRVKS
jgi:uncharacterized repeat protein (TIGR04076 family)